MHKYTIYVIINIYKITEIVHINNKKLPVIPSILSNKKYICFC